MNLLIEGRKKKNKLTIPKFDYSIAFKFKVLLIIDVNITAKNSFK